MIRKFASPAVCVIDDEEQDYSRILDALMTLGLGCVHVRGGNGDPLPPEPFPGLRIVFTDLHLTSEVGKTAASHTANVVRKVVPASGGPVLVVIWSKYATDPAGEIGLPPEDQPTEADLFRNELISSEPKYKSRLVFVEMNKPKQQDRPAIDEWIDTLKSEIGRILDQYSAFDVLWAWEFLIRSAGIEVSETLVNLTENVTGAGDLIENKLKLILRLLVQKQGGPDNSPSTTARHLLTVLSQIGLDILESLSSDPSIQVHADWLRDRLDEGTFSSQPVSQLNAFVLTSVTSSAPSSYVPGIVYDIVDADAFKTNSGFSIENLQHDCCNKTEENVLNDFKSRTKAIVLDITPVCDFHQGNSRCAMLLAGLIFPKELKSKVHNKDACKQTPLFLDRHDQQQSDIGFVFCSRYHFTVPLGPPPSWLHPHLRLRDGIATDIRNWHANQTSRVGYLSFN